MNKIFSLSLVTLLSSGVAFAQAPAAAHQDAKAAKQEAKAAKEDVKAAKQDAKAAKQEAKAAADPAHAAKHEAKAEAHEAKAAKHEDKGTPTFVPLDTIGMTGCVMLVDPHFAHAVGVSRATVTCAHALQYQAGISCPHQSWREMHQSWMLVIQCMYVLVHSTGVKVTRPSRLSTRITLPAACTSVRNRSSLSRNSSSAWLVRSM